MMSASINHIGEGYQDRYEVAVHVVTITRPVFTGTLEACEAYCRAFSLPVTYNGTHIF